MKAKDTQHRLIIAIQLYAVCNMNDAEWKYNDLLNRLHEHEEQLCKEQREICDEDMRIDDGIVDDYSIINARMPEL